MHQMPIINEAVSGRILAHGRNDSAVFDAHIAQEERLEHRRHWRAVFPIFGFSTRFFRTEVINRFHKLRRAQCEIVISDGFGSRHQTEDEAQIWELPEALDLFKPDEADFGRVLGFFNFRPADVFIIGEGLMNMQAFGAEGIMQSDGVFHREFRARTNREMR